MTLDLDAIRARLAAVPEGPWEADETEIYADQTWIAESIQVDAESPHFNHIDLGARIAQFIAHSRQDIEDLLAEVERLRAYIDGQDDTIGSLRQDVELQTKAAFDNQAEAARLRDDYECAHADRLARTLERDRTIDEREYLKSEVERLRAELAKSYADEGVDL